MRSTLLVTLLLVGFVYPLTGAEPAKALFGRWRAETVPTGYWIIDRYPDGRYAQKHFLNYDYGKPSEISVIWGRWKVKGKRYSSIIDGSTSTFLSRFIGKWKTTKIVAIHANRFEFMSSDGQPRYELPFADAGDLRKISMAAPAGLYGANATVFSTNLDLVPKWADSCPNR